MGLYIGNEKKKPYLGGNEIKEAYIGNTKIYPDQPVFSGVTLLNGIDGMVTDLYKIDDNKIAVACEGIKYYNPISGTFSDSNISLWHVKSGQFFKAVDGNVYYIGNKYNDQINLYKYINGEWIVQKIGITEYQYCGYVNAINGITYLFFKYSGSWWEFHQIDQDGVLSKVKTVPANNLYYGFTSQITNKTFFISGAKNTLYYVNKNSTEIEEYIIDPPYGTHNIVDMIEYNGNLYAFSNEGYFYRYNANTDEFDNLPNTGQTRYKIIKSFVTPLNDLLILPDQGKFLRYNPENENFIPLNTSRTSTISILQMFTATNGTVYARDNTATKESLIIYQPSFDYYSIGHLDNSNSEYLWYFVKNIGDYSYASTNKSWYRKHKNASPTADWEKFYEFSNVSGYNKVPNEIIEIDGTYYVIATKNKYGGQQYYDKETDWKGLGILI
jgi:hypothetical protein